MNLTDPISNALTVIRNGSMARKIKVDVKFSKITEEILNILKRDKFIKDFKFIDDKTREIKFDSSFGKNIIES